MSKSELDHKHIFVESPASYTLVCRCGIEIGVTSQPDILLQTDDKPTNVLK